MIRGGVRKSYPLLILVLFLFLVSGVPRADATVIELSDYSSNGTEYTLPEWLSADLDFVVAGATLTLEVTNLTDGNPAHHQFDLTQIFFNFGGGITGVTFSGSYPGWGLTVDPDNIHVDGFGYYDIALIDGDGAAPKAVKPGETKTFVFNVVGTGPFSDADFTTHMSILNGSGDMIGLAAGKFISGGPSGDESSFGMAVPEPTTICLLGVGGLCLLCRKKSA